MQQDAATIFYIIHIYIHIYIYILFKVHVSCSPSYEISRVTCADFFLAADQGGIRLAGGVEGALSGDSLLSALNFRERASHLPQY